MAFVDSATPPATTDTAADIDVDIADADGTYGTATIDIAGDTAADTAADIDADIADADGTNGTPPNRFMTARLVHYRTIEASQCADMHQRRLLTKPAHCHVFEVLGSAVVDRVAMRFMAAYK